MAKIKDDEVKSIIQSFWSDIGQITSDLSTQRLMGIKYYNRDYFGNERDGWSDFVSSDVFDAVEWTLAECMDIFFSTTPIGTFIAENMEDVEAADRETKAVKTIIEEKNNGFLLFYTWLKDALIQKNGIVKCYWDEVVYKEKESYREQSYTSFAKLMQDKDVEVKAVTARIGEQEISLEDVQSLPPEIAMQAVFDIDCIRKENASQVKIENVQPENFFIDKTHPSLNVDDAMFVAERVFVRRSDLIPMGYTWDQINQIPKTTILFNSQEERARDGDKISSFQNLGSGDAATLSDRVEILECYFRADVKNNGDMRLYRAIVGGLFGFNQSGNGVNVVLECKEADSIPYCCLSPNIIPHRFWGISKYDEVGDIQRFKSTLLRGALDNMIQHNAPQTLVPASANLDTQKLADAEPGEVHVANDTAGIISLNIDYVADKNIPILGLMDDIAEKRTGISKVSQGLDPKALSESTQFVGASIMNASQKKLKNIVRIFAETGIKSLYLKTHELLRKYVNDAMVLRDNGKYYEVDPREWRKRKAFDITIGTGRTDKDAKISALQGVLNLQQQIAMQGLNNNPLITPQHLYKTMSELVTLTGLGDVEKYFSNPENFQPQPPEQQPMDKAMDIEEARVTADATYKAETLQLEKFKVMTDAQIQREKIELEREKIRAGLVETAANLDQKQTASLIKHSQDIEKQVIGTTIQRMNTKQDETKEDETDGTSDMAGQSEESERVKGMSDIQRNDD